MKTKAPDLHLEIDGTIVALIPGSGGHVELESRDGLKPNGGAFSSARIAEMGAHP